MEMSVDQPYSGKPTNVVGDSLFTFGRRWYCLLSLLYHVISCVIFIYSIWYVSSVTQFKWRVRQFTGSQAHLSETVSIPNGASIGSVGDLWELPFVQREFTLSHQWQPQLPSFQLVACKQCSQCMVEAWLNICGNVQRKTLEELDGLHLMQSC